MALPEGSLDGIARMFTGWHCPKVHWMALPEGSLDGIARRFTGWHCPKVHWMALPEGSLDDIAQRGLLSWHGFCAKMEIG